MELGYYHSKLWLITDDKKFKEKFEFFIFKFFSILKKERSPTHTENSCPMWYISIGAGSGQGSSGSGGDEKAKWDELYAAFNRENDLGAALGNPVLVSSFDSQGGEDFIRKVEVSMDILNKNFENTDLEYELFPNQTYTGWGWDEYNSNSYISGLLKWLGYSIPPSGFPDNKIPGYKKPVPSFVYETSFPNDWALKDKWRDDYPGF